MSDPQGTPFQYPDLGSFDCNPIVVGIANRPLDSFSILTSDRLTATAYF